MLWVREYTELGVLLEALRAHGTDTESAESAFATIEDVWDNSEPLSPHPKLTTDEILDFVPLLYDVEEEVGLPLTDDEVWCLHGVVSWYSDEVNNGWIIQGVLDRLTDAVARTDHPPY